MVPEVKECTAENCFYNRDDECRAYAILVGSDDPVCETYTTKGQATGHTNKHGQGEVGACHVDNCEYNDNLFCHACTDIEVKIESGNAMCATYEPR